MKESTLHREHAGAAAANVLAEIDVKPLWPCPRKPWLPPDRWGVPLPVAIGVGALAYPVIAIPMGMLVLVLDQTPPTAGDWMLVVVASIVIPVVVALGTGWFAMFLAWGIWYVALAVTRSLRLSIDDARLSAHVGGGTSLVLCYLVWSLFQEEFLGGWSQIPLGAKVFLFAFGPGIFTPLAQYAGAWSQWPAEPTDPPRSTRGFSIYHVLVATAWLAGALTLLKLLGLLEYEPTMFLGIWLLYQLLTLKLVFRYAAWKVRRKGLVGGRWGWRGRRA